MIEMIMMMMIIRVWEGMNAIEKGARVVTLSHA